MLAKPIARAFDLDDDGMMEQSVEERGGNDGIAEDVAPFGEAAIGGEDHGALLVAGVDELEEEIAATGNDRQVADLVDDQERGSAEMPEALAELSLPLSGCQRGNDVGEGGEVDAPSGLDRLDRERGGQMALAGAGRTEEVHHFGAVDEGEFGECEDPLPVERGLEGEVEASERLDRGEASQRQCGLDAAALANRQILDEELIEGFDAIDLALLDTAERRVEHFQGPRHAKCHQTVLDAVEGGGSGTDRHGRPPATASRSPTAW